MSEYAHLDNKVKDLHRHIAINTQQLELLNSKVNHINTQQLELLNSNVQDASTSEDPSSAVLTGQVSLTDLELIDSSNNVTLLASGETGNIEMNGTLSVDTINEKTTNGNISIIPTGTGNVGIGTTSPSALLHVAGDIKTDGKASLTDLELIDSSNNVTLLASGETGNIEMNGTLSVDTINEKTTNGNISIIPTGTGNVGIGTTTPSALLHVAGNVITNGSIEAAKNTQSTSFLGKAKISHIGDAASFSHHNFGALQNYALLQNVLGQTVLNANTGEFIAFRIGNGDKMRLLSDGKFGIGTITPGALLHVAGDIKTDNDIDIYRALSVNGNYGTAGQMLTSNGSGNAMSWTQAGDLQSWSGTNPQGFRSENEIDIMGGDIYMGNAGGDWRESSPSTPWNNSDYWQWTAGYNQSSRNTGSNYTEKNEVQSYNTYITSTRSPQHLNYISFMPSNQIRLESMGKQGGAPQHHLDGEKPEILLQCDNTNTNTTDYPYNGQAQIGGVPNEGMWPKITIHAGGWSQGTHTTNPNSKQNAGFLHMAAGHSAALLSRRVYIGVAQSPFYVNRNSPLGLTHQGYGRDFNQYQSSGTYPNSFDPCDGQSYTEILSISSKDIEIVSNNTVEFSNSIRVQGTFYSSDDRLKHNEQDLTNSLEIIRQLKPMKYQKTQQMKEADFNGTLEENEYIIESGFIAQDILKLPELAYCVTGGDETKTVTNEEGIETQVNIEKPYSVNYNNIFTHNVAATQELDTIVTNLLTKIATLEARITELENK